MTKNRKQNSRMIGLNQVIKNNNLSDIEISGILDNVPKYKYRVTPKTRRKIKRLVNELSKGIKI